MKHRFFAFGLFILYIVVMTAVMIWQGIGIAPDRYAFVLLFASLLVKKTRAFLMDWIPFLFILVSYDFLRSLAGVLEPKAHYIEPIQAELAVFGQIPTITLQNQLYNPNQLSFLDYFSTVIYFLHFALPLSFGFLIWIYNKSYFRQFVTAILILSYLAWATYVYYPAAPPWLAQERGYISGVTKIIDKTFQAFPDKWNLPTVYHEFNPNRVAAIPSLHAAYPLLILFFAVLYFGIKGLLFLPYVLAVWFSIIYLGEHYVIDIIIGALYTVFSFTVAIQILHHVKFLNALVNLRNKLQMILKNRLKRKEF